MFLAEVDEGITLEWFTPEEILGWGSYDADSFGISLEETLDEKREDYHYDDIVESIRTRGFWRPLTGTRDHSGYMKLGDGHHRFAASVDLGLDSVPVQIHRYKSGISWDIISSDSGDWQADDAIATRFEA